MATRFGQPRSEARKKSTALRWYRRVASLRVARALAGAPTLRACGYREGMRPPSPDAIAAGVAANLPHDVPFAIVRDGHRTVVACTPEEIVVASGPATIEPLDDLAAGWWAGFVAYELGHAIERVCPPVTVAAACSRVA